MSEIIDVTAALIIREGLVLIARRASGPRERERSRRRRGIPAGRYSLRCSRAAVVGHELPTIERSTAWGARRRDSVVPSRPTSSTLA